jgi:hypothetical protein
MALMCDKCGKEIFPGSAVELISLTSEDGEVPRISTGDDMLIVHERCPT